MITPAEILSLVQARGTFCFASDSKQAARDFRTYAGEQGVTILLTWCGSEGAIATVVARKEG